MTHPRPTPRARIRRLITLWLISLLTAALLQLPIAWACAYCGRATTPGWDITQILRPANINSDAETIQIGSISHMGVRAVSVEAQPPTTLSRRYYEHNSAQPNSREVLAACAPWSPEQLHPALADASAWPAHTGVYSRPNLIHSEPLAFRLASGWPLPAVEGRITYDAPTRTFQYIGILTDPRFLPPPTSETGYLCYTPRWPQLLLNSLFDGTLLTLLLLAASLARRTIIARSRRARGLCATCAYDLRHTPPDTPCPECGTLAKLRKITP